MIGKRLKKNNHQPKLIDYQDFLRFRQQRQQIIKNPFEQNWKKAIAIEQMLSLYKLHQPTFVMSSPNKREKFEQYNISKQNTQMIDLYEMQNEESLMKKYCNMHLGIVKFDEQYQNTRIKKLQKTLQNLPQYQPQKVDQKNRQQKLVKYRKIQNLLFKKSFKRKIFADKNICFGEKLNEINNRRYLFQKQKQQIQKLQLKAIIELGLDFNKTNNNKKQEVKFNYEQFLKKQKLIFQKYIDNIQIKTTNHQSNQELQLFNKHNENVEGKHVPSSFYSRNKSSHLSEIRFIKPSKLLATGKKTYFRIAA